MLLAREHDRFPDRPFLQLTITAQRIRVEPRRHAAGNRKALGISNHTLVHGKAPEGLEHWPDPDAVFIGGSGGELAGLISLILQRMKPEGWLVMNFVTLENLAVAVETLKALGVAWDVLQLQASRSKPILHMHRMAAENPVWLVCAQKVIVQKTPVTEKSDD